MSTEEIKRFAQDAKADPELLKIMSQSGSDFGAVVAAANGKGYQFTLAEAEAAMAQSKLSQAQWAQIAGGKSSSSSSTSTTVEYQTTATTVEVYSQAVTGTVAATMVAAVGAIVLT
jgi:predicted ribosomally synthesized peptide with nif11-like leader